MAIPHNTINTRLDKHQKRYRVNLGITRNDLNWYVYADTANDALDMVVSHVAKLRVYPLTFKDGKMIRYPGQRIRVVRG